LFARRRVPRNSSAERRPSRGSIDTIIEVGFAPVSAAVIARRAEVSDGALFGAAAGARGQADRVADVAAQRCAPTKQG